MRLSQPWQAGAVYAAGAPGAPLMRSGMSVWQRAGVVDVAKRRKAAARAYARSVRLREDSAAASAAARVLRVRARRLPPRAGVWAGGARDSATIIAVFHTTLFLRRA